MNPDTVLILEGVPALVLNLKLKGQLHKVFVRAGEPARRLRVIADLILRGCPLTEAKAQYDARQSDEAPIIAGTARDTDTIVDFDAIFGSVARS